MGRPRLYTDDERLAARRANYRRYYDSHKEIMKQRNYAWRVKNPSKRKEYAKSERDRLREEVFTNYGKECACCGESEKSFLTLDHINRDGRKDSIAACGIWNVRGHVIYRKLRKDGWPKEGYQILCMNCNWAGRFGVCCPHKKSCLSENGLPS